MKKTFVHPFHNSTVALDVTVGRNLTEGQQKKLEKELCGMSDCRCNMYPVQSSDGHWTIYQDGEVYADEAAQAAAALGSIGGKSTSEAKRASAAENGKKGGRPRKTKE